MTSGSRLITEPQRLLSSYDQFDQLQYGDIVCGRIPLKRGEEHILCDLADRGVKLIPSATAQMASRSKTFQAKVFTTWMIPHTFSIYDRHQLLEISNVYHMNRIDQVILKQDAKNAGIGILLFSNIEEIYNQAASDLLNFPFVIQPFISDCKDLRVIVLGEYIEAYTRFNPNGFRNNLHCGGRAQSYTVTSEIKNLCTEIMKRGKFPYAYIDFMLTPTGEIYLAEINLRGGLRGAAITAAEHKQKTAAIEKSLVQKAQSTSNKVAS